MTDHIDSVTAMVLRDGVIKDLNTDAKTINDEVKADLVAQGMKPSERRSATIGDTVIGTVTRSNPKPSLEVEDDEALLVWAVEHAPHAIEQRVSPGWVTQVKKDGGVIDPATGEIVVPPGMKLTRGTPTFSMRRTDEGRALTRQIASRLVGTALELETGHEQ